MVTLVVFIAGLFIGVLAGAMAMALCVAASDVDGWSDKGGD